MDHLKMYFLLKNGDIPASYVSLPEGIFYCKKNRKGEGNRHVQTDHYVGPQVANPRRWLDDWTQIRREGSLVVEMGECALLVFSQTLGGCDSVGSHKHTGVTGLVLWEVCWPGCSWDCTFHWTGWIRGPWQRWMRLQVLYDLNGWNLVLLVVKRNSAFKKTLFYMLT